MKKILSLILAALICMMLFACGSSSGSNEKSPEDKVESAAESYAITYCTLNYDVKNTTVTITSVENSGDKYTVYGKVTCLDDYNDKYVGKFTAVYEWNSEKAVQKDFDLDTPTKEN